MEWWNPRIMVGHTNSGIHSFLVSLFQSGVLAAWQIYKYLVEKVQYWA